MRRVFRQFDIPCSLLYQAKACRTVLTPTKQKTEVFQRGFGRRWSKIYVCVHCQNTKKKKGWDFYVSSCVTFVLFLLKVHFMFRCYYNTFQMFPKFLVLFLCFSRARIEKKGTQQKRYGI